MARITIVEDEPAVALGLIELLKTENHEVIHFDNGEDAVAAFGDQPADLVLLDITLPGMNGYDVCRRLRSGGFVQPVIMVSARSQPVDRVVGLEVGADDYVTKPFNTRELIARISAQLRSADRIRNAPVGQGEARRHLLAIFFSDICGYSRIMHEDESHGISLLHDHNTLMTQAIEAHAGDVVEIIGDAFLARFESAVDAVRTALQVQADFRRRNSTKADHDHILVRIGIHLGDVLDYGNSLKGDTINIAARLQQLAEPGSICISEDVHSVVAPKIDCTFEELGQPALKNISQRLKIWKVIELSAT